MGFENASSLCRPNSVPNFTKSYIPISIQQSMIATSSLSSARVFKQLRPARVKERGHLCVTASCLASAQDLPPQVSIAFDFGTGQSVLCNRSLLQPDVVQSLAVCACRSYNPRAVECFTSPQSCPQAVPVYDFLTSDSYEPNPSQCIILHLSIPEHVIPLCSKAH